ncbi:DUF6036 family nucleotidyltransferase [Agromyces bauzanensis]
MTRDELMELARQAIRLVPNREVLIVGSQSILGTIPEDRLPPRATLSREADIAPTMDDDDGTIATIIDAHLGEMSDFDRVNGFYAQGVSTTTAVLPAGWERRATIIHPDGPGNGTAWFIGPYDLCASKLVRGEEKDIEFVSALISAGIIDPDALTRIAGRLPVSSTVRRIVQSRVIACSTSTTDI